MQTFRAEPGGLEAWARRLATVRCPAPAAAGSNYSVGGSLQKATFSWTARERGDHSQ